MPKNLKQEGLKVSRIRNGTVIDHLNPGTSVYVLDILKEPSSNVISLAMNVESGRLGRKDIVKIEDRYPDERETDMISLISPRATINTVRSYLVVKKDKVELPREVRGLVRCKHDTCISNSVYESGNREPVLPRLKVIENNPVVLECHYCDRRMEFGEIPGYFIHRF